MGDFIDKKQILFKKYLFNGVIQDYNSYHIYIYYYIQKKKKNFSSVVELFNLYLLI